MKGAYLKKQVAFLEELYSKYILFIIVGCPIWSTGSLVVFFFCSGFLDSLL